MRFKIQKERDWHRWFAWYPVKTEGSERVWLEYVERRWNPRTMHRYTDSYEDVWCYKGWRYR